MRPALKPARRRRSRGATLIELMVSMGLFVLGFIGVVALLTTSVNGNRQARNLERAVDSVEQLMEDLRGTSTEKLVLGPSHGGPAYPDVTTSDGMTYRRSYSVAALPGQATLVLVTATVTYVDEEDKRTSHTQTMKMIRTTPESL